MPIERIYSLVRATPQNDISLMSYTVLFLQVLFLALIAQLLPGAEFVVPKQITIGYNLQVFTSIKLCRARTPGRVGDTLKSVDPQNALKFAMAPDKAGYGLTDDQVNSGYRDTPDFYLQGFADRGTARYT